MNDLLDDFREDPPLWKKRWHFFFAFIGFTIYWVMVLTIPMFEFAGSGKSLNGLVKLGIFLPFFGIAFALSSFTRFSPIYRTTRDDMDIIVVFAALLVIFPLFLHLHELREIEISEGLWHPAWISSLLLGLGAFTWAFLRFRKRHYGLAMPILLSLLALPVGILLGGTIFKGISYFFGSA